MQYVTNFTLLVIIFLSLHVALSEVSICTRFECPKDKSYPCHTVSDTIKCLWEINDEKEIVGTFMPEVALLAGYFFPSIKINAILMPKGEITSIWQNQIVIVTNKVVTRLKELRGFKYYHIGLENVNLKSYIANEFEERILENYTTDSCRDSPTLAEQNICKLEEFFGPSCRNGSWVDYEEQKFAFRKDYPNLTSLCNNNAKFKVLNDTDGVIVVTTLELIKEVIGVSFYYLWDNFETAIKPYSWYSQPWPLVLTHKNNFGIVRHTLKSWFGECQNFLEEQYDVNDASVELEYRYNFPNKQQRVCESPNFTNGFFFHPPFVRIFFKNEQADLPPWKTKDISIQPLRWCTTSEEETSKCEWMRLVAYNLAYPIDCIQKGTRCLEAIKYDVADIVAVNDPPALKNLMEVASVKKCDREFCGDNAKVLSSDKILMRENDPNRANAKVLLESLMKYFLGDKGGRLFDLFGEFQGIPNLLFSSYPANMIQFNVDKRVDSTSRATSPPRLTPTYTVCAKRKFHQEECRLMEFYNWNCYLVDNILDCLENLNNRNVDLALITHEEADLVAENLTNIEIVGQVRPIEDQHKKSEFIFNFSALSLSEGRDNVAVNYMTHKFWPMIVSNKKMVNVMSKLITDIFPEKIIDSEMFPEEQHPLNSMLSTLVLMSQSDKIFLQESHRNLKEFMEHNKALLSYHNGRSIGWCTSSKNEEDKCNWFGQTMRKYITLANIRCVFKNNCLEEFMKADSEVDVLTTFNKTNMDFGENFGLITALTEESYSNWTLVMKENLKSDVSNILKAAIKLFAGAKTYKPFELFGKFRTKSNLLFPDATYNFEYNPKVKETKKEDENKKVKETKKEEDNKKEFTICAKHNCPHEINQLCRPVKNTFECLQKIDKNYITLGLAMPHEASLASSNFSNIIIAAKLIPAVEVASNWQYEIVVVTNREIQTWHDMQNFRYYHVGLENLNLTRYIPNQFEEMIIKNYLTEECDDTQTLAEKEICKINEFFGPSCRRSSWADYDEQKFAFTKQYTKLTQLCRKKASLEILNDNNGVIVATTLESIKKLSHLNFYYLWNNGMTSKDPYSWYKQSWPLILTHKGNDFVREKIMVWFGDCRKLYNPTVIEPNCYNLKDILLLPEPYRIYVQNEQADVPQWYSKEIPSGVSPLKWCTISKEETLKCQRMKLLAGNLAYPIDCVQKKEKADCYTAIENKVADIVAAKNPPDLRLLNKIATVEYSLKQESDSEGTISSILMRNDDPNIANAKVLLATLKRYFIDEMENSLLDLMGPNLLFESFTDNMIDFKSNWPMKDMDNKVVVTSTITSTSTVTSTITSTSTIITTTDASLNVIPIFCVYTGKSRWCPPIAWVIDSF